MGIQNKNRSGTLSLSFPNFDIESGDGCGRDFLQVSGTIKDYGKTKLCGNNVPDGASFESKHHTLTIKFVSNGSKRKSGFLAKITAN